MIVQPVSSRVTLTLRLLPSALLLLLLADDVPLLDEDTATEELDACDPALRALAEAEAPFLSASTIVFTTRPSAV